MTLGRLSFAVALAMVLASAGSAAATDRPALTLASSSSHFDRSCRTYYLQGNDQDVAADSADPFCRCIAGEIQAQGLGSDVLDFLGRTYAEDLTTFIDEYPSGRDWMEAYFAAEQACKAADYGSVTPKQAPNPAPGPIRTFSQGGIAPGGRVQT